MRTGPILRAEIGSILDNRLGIATVGRASEMTAKAELRWMGIEIDLERHVFIRMAAKVVLDELQGDDQRHGALPVVVDDLVQLRFVAT